MTQKLTFEQWLTLVDSWCWTLCSMSGDDLPDCCYRDWWEEGISPKTAAKRAIRMAME